MAERIISHRARRLRRVGGVTTVLAAVAIVAGGCGGNFHGTTAGPRPTATLPSRTGGPASSAPPGTSGSLPGRGTAPSPGTTIAPPTTASVKAELLAPTAVPPGWTVAPPGPATPPAPAGAPPCTFAQADLSGQSFSTAAADGEVTYQSQANGDGPDVSEDIGAYATQAQAAAEYTTSVAAYTGCPSFTLTFTDGKSSTLSVAHLPLSPLGDRSAAFTASFAGQTPGQQEEIGILFVEKGNQLIGLRRHLRPVDGCPGPAGVRRRRHRTAALRADREA